MQDLAFPVANVLAIFAKENSQGMQFELEPFQAKPEQNKSQPASSGLKLVK